MPGVFRKPRIVRLICVARLVIRRLHRAVGVNDSVEDALPVRRLLAEIPAEGVKLPAGLFVGRQKPLIGEIPKGAAENAVRRFDRVLKTLHAAGVVVEVVEKLVYMERILDVLPARRRLFDPRKIRILARAHVREKGVALVVHGARRVVRLDPVVADLEIVAGAGFVAHRPHDDRRMVAVALYHRDLAFEMRVEPFGAEGKRRERIADAVRLEVRLIHHVDADLVAEIVEFVRLGTVRIADVVEVAFLDKLDVLPQTPRRAVVPVDRVHLGTVYALEFDGLAVDEKRAVARILRLGYLDFPETEIEGYPFRDERVEIRDLRAPELRSAHAPFSVGYSFEFHFRPALFVNLELRRTVGRERKNPVAAVDALLLGMRLEPDVFQMAFFQAVHANGPYDAGKTEHILTFEIRAVAVAVDLHGDGVSPALEIFRHIVHRRRAAVLGKADV